MELPRKPASILSPNPEFLRCSCFSLIFVVVAVDKSLCENNPILTTILKNFAKLSCSDGSGWIKDGLWNFTFSSPHHHHKGFLNHFGNTGSCTLSRHLFGSLALSLFHSQPVLYWDAQLIFLNSTSNCIAHYSEKASFCLPAWEKISLTGINDPQQANFIMAYTLITPFEELLLHSKHSHVFWLNPFPHDVSPSWNTFLHSPTGTCQTTTYPSKVIYNSP